MADQDMALGHDTGETRRSILSVSFAVLAHIVLIVIALFAAAQGRAPEPGPIVLEFDVGAAGIGGQQGTALQSPAAAAPAQPSADVGAVAAPPAGATRLQAAPASSQQAAPASSQPASTSTTSSGDFVIPSPRSTAQTPSGASGPSFRQSGTSAVTTAQPMEPLISTGSPSDVPVPTAAVGGSQATGGSGSVGGNAPGQGVEVSGGTRTGGKLDLGSLDTALAGRSGTGGGQGSGGGGGSGQTPGGQTPGGQTPGGQGGGGGSSIQWDKPADARNRLPLSLPDPKLPAWVAKQGLTLRVTVSFVVTPEGVVASGSEKIERSSGYGDVDAAVKNAVGFWRFTADDSAASLRGTRSFVFQF